MNRSLNDIFLDALSEALWVILKRKEPLQSTVSMTVGNQQRGNLPRPRERRSDMATKTIKSDQWVLIDPDFKGRLSGNPADVDVMFTLNAPGGLGLLEEDLEEIEGIIGADEFARLVGEEDKSVALFMATPGESGIASVTWAANTPDSSVQGLVEIQVEGENLVFADTNLNVGNQAEPTDEPEA